MVYFDSPDTRSGEIYLNQFHMYDYRVNRDLRTADWKYDRIRKAGLACPATGSLPIITLLSFNYSVWSFCKLAERLGTALLVFLPGAFFHSDNALLHFALAGPSPHCPRRGEITMTINRIARIALFASLAVLLSAFLASSGGHPAAK